MVPSIVMLRYYTRWQAANMATIYFCCLVLVVSLVSQDSATSPIEQQDELVIEQTDNSNNQQHGDSTTKQLKYVHKLNIDWNNGEPMKIDLASEVPMLSKLLDGQGQRQVYKRSIPKR